MKFNVSTPQGKRPVEFKFASDHDLRTLLNWKSKVSLRNNPHVEDAIEYSRLAGKRWRTYSKNKRTATSIGALRSAIGFDPTCEVAFVLIAYASWHAPSAILGFCFCRRTWSNRIILDFAAAHPNAIFPAGGSVNGVGSAMLYSLVALARDLEIDTVWGEATKNSAAFYRHVLNDPTISDSFFIKDQIFERCLARWQLTKIQ
jgi:hypothetical protein